MHNAIYSNLLLPISVFFIFIFSSPLSLYSSWFRFIFFPHWIFYIHFYIFFFPLSSSFRFIRFVFVFYLYSFASFLAIPLYQPFSVLSYFSRYLCLFDVRSVSPVDSFDQAALKLIKAGSYVRVPMVLRYGMRYVVWWFMRNTSF